MTITLDGTVTGSIAAASGTVSLVTTNANDILVAAFVINSHSTQTVTSVTSVPALTWTKRKAEAAAGTVDVELWYTTWNSSGTISVVATITATGTWGVVACGFTGGVLTSPFDSNGSLPSAAIGSSTIAAATITTSNATDLLIGVGGMAYGGTLNAQTGWTRAAQTHTGAASTLGACIGLQYLAVSTAQTATVSPTFSHTGEWAVIADAFVVYQAGTVALTETHSDTKTALTVLPTYQIVKLTGTQSDTGTAVKAIASGSAHPAGTLSDTGTIVKTVASGKAVGTGNYRDISPPSAKPTHQALLPAGTEHDTVALVSSGNASGAGTEHDTVALIGSGKAAPTGTEHDNVALASSGGAHPAGTAHDSVALVASGSIVNVEAFHDTVAALAPKVGIGAGTEHDSVLAIASGSKAGSGTEHDTIITIASGKAVPSEHASDTVALTASSLGVGKGKASDAVGYVASQHANGQGAESATARAVASGFALKTETMHGAAAVISHQSLMVAESQQGSVLVTTSAGAPAGSGRFSNGLMLAGQIKIEVAPGIYVLSPLLTTVQISQALGRGMNGGWGAGRLPDTVV